LGKAADRIARLLPQARNVTIAGAGHAVHFDNPAGFAAAIRSAVGRQGTRMPAAA
jgi:pimeloyl-ACP methyl ester carboxylesterase